MTVNSWPYWLSLLNDWITGVYHHAHLVSFLFHPFGKQWNKQKILKITKIQQQPANGKSKRSHKKIRPKDQFLNYSELAVLATYRVLKKNKEVGNFFLIPLILRKECLVCLLIIFRIILSRKGTKIYASCKTGCNVNLKHICMKSGIGGVRGCHSPAGPEVLFLSSTFGKWVCIPLPLSGLVITSFKDVPTSDHVSYCFSTITEPFLLANHLYPKQKH
jgi:hypothetical protein